MSKISLKNILKKTFKTKSKKKINKSRSERIKKKSKKKIKKLSKIKSSKKIDKLKKKKSSKRIEEKLDTKVENLRICRQAKNGCSIPLFVLHHSWKNFL